MSDGQTYRKMRGLGGAFSPARAYLADDHLLLVHESIAAQEYRRFYFRDIQAIIVRTRPARRVLNVLLCVAFVVVLVAMLAVDVVPEHKVGLHGERIVVPAPVLPALIAPAAILAVLIVNILRGPTVDCHIQTAAHVQRMPMIKRLRQARRFIQQLRGPIEQVQGEMTIASPPRPPSTASEPPPITTEAP